MDRRETETGGLAHAVQSSGRHDGDPSGEPAQDGWIAAAGTVVTLGAEGTFELRADGTGRFRYTAEAELPEGAGWDGERAWRMGVTGVPRTVHDHERARSLLEWWVWTGFVTAPAFPGVLTADGAAGDGRSFRVRLGEVEGRLVLSSDGDPDRLEMTDLNGPAVTRYGGWKGVGSRRLPGHAVTEQGGVAIRTLMLEEVRTSGDPLGCDAPPPPPVSFDPEADPKVPVTRAPTGHLLVKPRVEGRESGWFILDTGGGAGVVSSALVREMGWEPVGNGVLTSVHGTAPARWFQVGPLALGPLTLERAPMAEMDLDFLTRPLGTPVAGILGYGVFSRVLAEVIPATSTLRLLPPHGDARREGAWQELRLVDLVPTMRAVFPHGEGVFRLDLGAVGPAGGVVFHSPAVREMGLDRVLPTKEVAPGVPGLATRLEWLEVGGHRLEDVPTLLWTAAQGALTDPHLTGNLGLTVLADFSLVLDYPRERLILTPLGEGP